MPTMRAMLDTITGTVALGLTLHAAACAHAPAAHTAPATAPRIPIAVAPIGSPSRCMASRSCRPRPSATVMAPAVSQTAAQV